MKKKYKGIDLFCGIGGFRLAMNSSQVECVFSSDNDKFAQQTYRVFSLMFLKTSFKTPENLIKTRA